MTNNKVSAVNYKFIDSLRFISMVSIVMEHSSPLLGKIYQDRSDQYIQIAALQPFKFGTIIFFLLAGFLIGDKFTTYNTREYLKRRLDNTFKPWLFWLLVLLSIYIADMLVRYFKFGNTSFVGQPFTFLLLKLDFIVFGTAFWFIINFMICITILLIFRKYIFNYGFGIILALFSLYYSVNIYFRWTPTSHTTALFGFIFFLWLGVQLHVHYVQFNKWISRQSFLKLLLAVVITFALSCLEGHIIMRTDYDDAFNTLRFSNILFSLASFLLLFRFGDIKIIQKLQPRKTTFGIYLIHQIIILQVLPLIYRPLHIDFDKQSVIQLVAYQFISFFIAYFTAYFLTVLISKSDKFKWSVGQ